MAQFSWSELFRRAALDHNPPLYYALLKVWIAGFGDSAAAMRWMSVVLGSSSCVGVYLLVVESFEAAVRTKAARWSGLFAAALVSASVFLTRWDWEARMYSLGAALAVWSSWLLLRALAKPAASWGAWILYALVALAFAYTHTYALLSLAAQAIYAVLRIGARVEWNVAAALRSPQLPCATLAGAVVLAGFAPWPPILLQQRSQVQESFWTEPISVSLFGKIAYDMVFNPDARSAPPGDAALAAALIAAVPLSLLWRPHWGDAFAVLGAGLPFFVAAAITALDTKILHARYLFFAHLFFLAGIARLVGRVKPPICQAVVAVVILANLVWHHVAFREGIELNRLAGIRAAADYIADRRRTGEPVIVATPYFYLPIRYHLGDAPYCRLLQGSRPVPRFAGTAVFVPADFVSRDEFDSLAGERVWVVDTMHGEWPRYHAKQRDGWREISRREFFEGHGLSGMVEVIEYRVAGDRADDRTKIEIFERRTP